MNAHPQAVDYVLVGGGAFAREVLDWFTPSLVEAGSRFVGYLDDGDAPMAAFGDRAAQLGTIADYAPDPAHRLVIAIGAPAGKQAVVEGLLAKGARFATLIHPLAWVAASARIGQGVLIGPFAYVAADAVIEDFVIQGGFSGVGHDVTVGAFTTMSGYVDLTGGVQVGRGAFFGTGARILPKLTIGEGARIGAGAVVVRSAAPATTLYAPPARSLTG